MKLDRLILVNWGQMRAGDYPMGDLTLLTGESGAGKSTMLDALQTVMTGAIKTILSYNPGQEESKTGQRNGKSKRSLEAYITGAEYSKFSRPEGAHGHIAAVFRPGKGEDNLKSFTALVSASATTEGNGETRGARLDQMELIIIDDAELRCVDLMVDVDTGETIAVEHIVRHLRGKFPRITDYGDKKRDYLSALYGRFRGRTSVTWDEASNAAKAWVQSIAYKPIGSVHELVRDEILDFDGKQLQTDIERISGLMRQVTNLRQEGARLESSVKRLAILRHEIDQTAEAFEQHVQQDLLVAELALLIDEEEVSAKSEIIDAEKMLVEKLGRDIAGWAKTKDSWDAQRIALSAQLLGIPAHGTKIDLDKQLAEARALARSTLVGLTSSIFAASQLENRARGLISRPISGELSRLRQSIEALAASLERIDISRLGNARELLLSVDEDSPPKPELLRSIKELFDGTGTGVEAVFASLVGTDSSVSLAVAAESSVLDDRIVKAAAQVRDLAAKKSQLAAGQVNLPRGIGVALERLKERYPEANAQVLCDLVEPRSEEWLPAIEAYFGGARFNLIVDERWEAKAIDFMRAHKLPAKVIQGSLCMKHSAGKALPPDSVVHELSSENPIARAFLADQFGSVVKVHDIETLRFTSRGVMKNGQGSGSRTMFADEARDLVFGQKARKHSLDRVTGELESAEADLSRLQELKNELDGLKLSLLGLKEPSFNVEPLVSAASTIEDAVFSLARLDLTKHDEISKSLNHAVAQFQELEGQIGDANLLVSQAKDRSTGAAKAIESIKGRKLQRLDGIEAQISRLKKLTEANPKLNYTVLAGQVETRLESDRPDPSKARADADTLARRPDRMMGGVHEALAQFNSNAKADERFAPSFPHLPDSAGFDLNYAPLVALGRSVNETINNMQGLGLYANREELHKAEASFHDVFTKQFCVEIKGKVDDGVRTLRQMNHELSNLKFGSDRFSIDWSRWEPEFQSYLGFFEAVTKLAESSETVDLFGEEALSDKHVEIRDHLVKLLLDEDQDRATRDLLRIADYRNYRRYDILNESDSGGSIRLSTWGTGSGGQLETPAYIVRAAIVTNRLKLFEKGPSLKLLVNDESFSRMDEARARAVLGFMRDNLDLQVISAMPTMKAGSLKDEFNREYSFTRLRPVQNGELDFMTECDERVMKSDKMRELWARQRALAREKAKQLFDISEPPPEAVPDIIAVAAALGAGAGPAGSNAGTAS